MDCSCCLFSGKHLHKCGFNLHEDEQFSTSSGSFYIPECHFHQLSQLSFKNITYHHQKPIWFSRLTNSLNGDFLILKILICHMMSHISHDSNGFISHDGPDEISRSGQRRAQLEVVDRFSRGVAGGFSGRMVPSGNLTFLMGKIWGKYMGNMMRTEFV